MASLRRGDDDTESPLSCHWLVKNGKVLASLETAETRLARLRGLLGRDGVDGAFLLPHTKSVHTLGMRFGLDVAFIDSENTVIKIVSLPPHRVSGIHMAASAVLEAQLGAFEAWGLQVGDTIEVSEECR